MMWSAVMKTLYQACFGKVRAKHQSQVIISLVSLHSYPHLWPRGVGSDRTGLQIQVKEQTSSSEWFLGCPSEVRTSVILVWLRVEQTLLYIKMNQLRWLRDPTPESLLDQVFQAHPTWRGLWGRPRKPQRDYVCCLAGLGMSLCTPDPDPNKYHDISAFQRMLYQMQQRSERVVA